MSPDGSLPSSIRATNFSQVHCLKVHCLKTESSWKTVARQSEFRRVSFVKRYAADDFYDHVVVVLEVACALTLRPPLNFSTSSGVIVAACSAHCKYQSCYDQNLDCESMCVFI